ncbi:hypothetical protein A3A70_02015 [candidate division WWE3 bacterium RIFCSPLOWO2_01_FULL_42_11]|uniref:phenylalanine--tRNA ligase n=1 Tax=candidate division WWE3 bacterium RIFCSPLOWO2_01_FULL_42_11 TaxID=1802627 RepID=A0A1F4VRA0_UNCKA|nr:MAG: hypothetical protein A3A70_02015 [candidate division WWE3 bacterium RIFCSPLOWO2_01_FULL_42_11]
MMSDTADLLANTKKQIQEVNSLGELNDLQLVIFSKKDGVLNDLIVKISQLDSKDRSKLGKEINEAKSTILAGIENRKHELFAKEEEELFDVTLPSEIAPTVDLGKASLHPLTETIREIEDTFSHLGFIRRRYRETDTDYYAFEALNMPQDHPARDEWETFYLTNSRQVITPHTSNGQIHEMELGKLPIRMINISRCGRRQEDTTHCRTFYQFEGLLIDENVSISDLKGVLTYFVHSFFGKNRQFRLRPYNFRFTEPSFEIDITCGVCSGNGCKTCKEGWMELGGAGMVHPNVLRAGKINPTKSNGFAFGWGVERVFAMRNLSQALPDIRILYQNDLRFLKG